MSAPPSAEYLAQSRVTDLNVCYSIPIPLEILSTSLRLWAELHPRRNGLAFDDFLMIWATAVSVGLCISGLVYGPPYGMGRHVEAVPEEEVKTFMLGDYVFSHFYDFAIASTKLSVLALYYRVFPKATFRRVVILTAVFVILWLMTMELVLGFQCRPIQKFWDPDVAGECFNLVAFSYFTNITNLVTDLWIFVLPLPIILRLHLPRNRKIGLSFLFSVGLAYVPLFRRVQNSGANGDRTCAVSAARLTVVVSQGSSDFTWAGVPLGILSTWEPVGGIICANLPVTYKPLAAAFRKVTGTSAAERSRRTSHQSPRSWYRMENMGRRKRNAHLEISTDNETQGTMDSRLEMGGIVVERSFNQESSENSSHGYQ
ncbi:putative integral membrane protein PTH11-like [Aspergillus lucknowensis]|uniref:Rhodopsin domain-containing protein n=1 Tax=Aspergillus lucknowensis TaxID=176173 RepID=A0ABR4LTF4_9EURO